MEHMKEVAAFGYALPEELIASQPLEKRDDSRLLILDKETGKTRHTRFNQLAELLTENDVLVFNQSKVFPARLIGKKETGKKIEVLLLYAVRENTWRAISFPGLKVGIKIFFSHNVIGEVIYRDNKTGEVDIIFNFQQDSFFDMLDMIGQTPIPHYISSSLSEKVLRERYQTVYAQEMGSVAAPTAGLHFTKNLMEEINHKNIQMEFITLHVGLGTFQKLREEHFKENALHTEYFSVSEKTAARLNEAKKRGKRIIAVGTTTTRTLESIVEKNGMIKAQTGETSLFIRPGYRFQFVESMITNFHLPYSSLLLLVAAFASYPNTEKRFDTFETSVIGHAYKEAIEKNYRFYSFGDAMWIQ